MLRNCWLLSKVARRRQKQNNAFAGDGRSLKERSLTVKCYVPPVSSASKPFSSRDLRDTTSILKDIHGAEGNTQGICFGMFMPKSIDGEC
jgi:hypothetical protein